MPEIKSKWINKEPKKEKVNSSRFFVTINSNQTSSKYKGLLHDAYNDFVENIEHFIKYKEDSHDKGWDKIKSIDFDQVLEVGDEQHRQHLHSFVDFKHNTKLQLDLNMMRYYFSKYLDLPSIHLDVKYVSDDKTSIDNYLRKEGYIK